MKRHLFSLIILSLVSFSLYGQSQDIVIFANGMPNSIGFTRSCNIKLFDNGAEFSNYLDNSNAIHTFVSPTQDRLVLTFETFSMSDIDVLYVYDGMTTDAPVKAIFNRLQPPTYPVLSTDSALTLRFISNNYGNAAGFKAYIKCLSCNPQSTNPGSPCAISENGGFTPICIDNNSSVSTPYHTATNTSANGAAQFLGTNTAGCLTGSITPPNFANPNWFILRTSNSGFLTFDIKLFDEDDIQMDVNFACWGPFLAQTFDDFNTLFCCGYYQLSTPPANTLAGNFISCGSSSALTENCFISNAAFQAFYVIMAVNPGGRQGTFTFTNTSTYFAYTDCTITSAFSVSPDKVCVGDSVIFSVRKPVPFAMYVYSGPNGFCDSTFNTSYTLHDITPEKEGDYILLVKDPNTGYNLFDTSRNTVTLNPRPNLQIQHNDTICNGIPLQILAKDTNLFGIETIFTWHFDEDIFFGSSVITQISKDANIRLEAMNIHRCLLDTNFIVPVSPVPEIVFSPPRGCSPQTFVAHTNKTKNKFLWETGDTTAYISNVTTISTKKIYLTVTDSLGCIARDFITIYPTPVVNFIPNYYQLPLTTSTSISGGEATIYFTNKSIDNEYHYFWNFGDIYSFENTSTDIHTYHAYHNTGKYPVTLTVATDPICVSSKVITINITDPFEFIVPSAFSPDGDGKNDIFYAKGNAFLYDKFVMRIYDRYGKLVFESKNPDIGWNGSDLKGKNCVSGVYTCVVQLTDYRLTPREYRQAVTLLRLE